MRSGRWKADHLTDKPACTLTHRDVWLQRKKKGKEKNRHNEREKGAGDDICVLLKGLNDLRDKEEV